MKPITNTKRLIGIVAGAGSILLALAVLAAGGGAIWADAHRGHDGYVSTGRHQFDTAGRALTSPTVEVGKAAPNWLIQRVRVSVTSTASGRPVFVGIGPSAAVSSYLANVSRSQLRDFDVDGGTPTYANQPGSRIPAPPATRRFWAASTEGHGTQTLSWKLKSGHWDVVVMNADGTPSVDAAVSLGAKTPPLLVPGLGLIALGILIGVGGFVLVLRVTRRPVVPTVSPVPATV